MGLEFHVHLLSGNRPFEAFADAAKQVALNLLTGDTASP